MYGRLRDSTRNRRFLGSTVTDEKMLTPLTSNSMDGFQHVDPDIE